MKPIDRSELLDYVTYGEHREEIRASALRAKSLRRILVGEHFTFLFENRETVRYQIQEMMRIERIVKEDEIQHELDTYNELIHPKGTVGCTLMVGIDDEAERAGKLRAWLGLNMMTEGRAGFRAFNEGSRACREADFILLRQRMAEGAKWNDELTEEILAKAHGKEPADG